MGSILIWVGCLLITLATVVYARGAVARDRARAAWDAMQAHKTVEGVRARFAARHAGPSPAVGSPVAQLFVPAAGIDEVVIEGVGDGELAAGPGHVPGSAMPGDVGNAIISAHRDRHFHALGTLHVGDTVVTETLAKRITWVVTARRVVDRHAPALWEATAPTLTLTTCWPISFFGSAPDRLIITAIPVVNDRRA